MEYQRTGNTKRIPNNNDFLMARNIEEQGILDREYQTTIIPTGNNFQMTRNTKGQGILNDKEYQTTRNTNEHGVPTNNQRTRKNEGQGNQKNTNDKENQLTIRNQD
jgi:hypothetical protein